MIFLPKPPKIIDKKENWALFKIEALYPGYGITIGNSLRRVLFSSLTGAAVTSVQIKGVQHQFSVIPGVLEDVISIMMNLKNMRFRVYGDEPQKAVLKIKGEKEIKGSDFKFPTQVELVNPSCHIATITDKKTELEIEIQIEKGIGYRPVEQYKKQKKSEIGVLAIDAVFTPIKKINYKVENMRVGERTDFDRLYLEITTDGTISPEEALFQASDILVKHFSLFLEAFKPVEKGKPSGRKKTKEPLKVKSKTVKKDSKKEGKKAENKTKKRKEK